MLIIGDSGCFGLFVWIELIDSGILRLLASRTLIVARSLAPSIYGILNFKNDCLGRMN